jgi:hypothetical protein
VVGVADEAAERAQVECAAVLESVATALANLVVSVRSAAAQLHPGSVDNGDHRCVMPGGAELYAIHRCPCGKSYRLYPSTGDQQVATLGAMQWREI